MGRLWDKLDCLAVSECDVGYMRIYAVVVPRESNLAVTLVTSVCQTQIYVDLSHSCLLKSRKLGIDLSGTCIC